MKKHNEKKLGVRALARRLHRSPSHICRVIQGERKPSAQLAAKLRKLGLKVEEAR